MKEAKLFTDIMEGLRADGWCVILKALPDDLPFIIEGSRSEYDAPRPDKPMKGSIGKWCVELSDMRWGRKPGARYRGSPFAMADTPREALTKILSILEANKKAGSRP